uniref:Putative secreted peptide n=1 Tax=Rhipicephalus pulchellus TaxID=72859 RepID=L7MBP3_RHIPC
MKQAYRVVLCLCVFSINQGQVYGRYRPSKPIGQGVEALVRVYYDNGYVLSEQTIKKLIEKNITKHFEQNITKHFEKIFLQIQEKLHNDKIMVNLTVQHVQKNDNLTVFIKQNETVNGNATLEALKGLLLQPPHLPNNTIGYHFTGYNINETRPDALYTNNTFCTEQPTATVLQSLQFTNFYLSAWKMTLFILGSNHTPVPDKEDYKRMNDSFWRCSHEAGKATKIS